MELGKVAFGTPSEQLHLLVNNQMGIAVQPFGDHITRTRKPFLSVLPLLHCALQHLRPSFPCICDFLSGRTLSCRGPTRQLHDFRVLKRFSVSFQPLPRLRCPNISAKQEHFHCSRLNAERGILMFTPGTLS